MNDACELINKVEALGATIRVDGSQLVIHPAKRVPADLIGRLKDRKPEVLSLLQTLAELRESMKRMESMRISVAIGADGRMHIVTEEDVLKAWTEGGTVYSPQAMFEFIRLDAAGRKHFRGLKGLRQG